jgi:hypothetical protein
LSFSEGPAPQQAESAGASAFLKKADIISILPPQNDIVFLNLHP